eukprot:6190174-Pleurochrysis_carterae.AAC.1
MWLCMRVKHCLDETLSRLRVCVRECVRECGRLPIRMQAGSEAGEAQGQEEHEGKECAHAPWCGRMRACRCKRAAER